MTDQEAVFREGEGDAWFARNAAALADRTDPPLQVLRALDRRERVASVADLGCANGWRLAALGPAFPNVRRRVGVDPSPAAIGAGRTAWPDLDLRVGTLAEPGLAGARFDLVLVCFVFYLVPPERVAQAVAAVDDAVAPGGVLLVADFMAEEEVAVPYHHRSDVSLFSRKADRAALFRARGYRETFRAEYDHDATTLPSLASTAWPSRENRSALSLLVKPA